MTSLRLATAAVTALLVGGVAACGDDAGDGGTAGSEPSTSAPAEPPVDRLPDTPLTGTPDPALFGPEIDNPWLPLAPGTRWVYRSRGEDDTRIVTTVTKRTVVVQGVTCRVVHDVESSTDGEVLEDTYDWYAQDTEGNVWYFGEDTTSYDEGKASKEGSWEAGVDGAQAGIIMLATPQVGVTYQQEFWAGEAEDQGEVLEIGGTHPAVPAHYGPLLVTADTTPLEPKLVEHKYYAEGIGVVYEETVRGGEEVVVLLSVNH